MLRTTESLSFDELLDLLKERYDEMVSQKYEYRKIIRRTENKVYKHFEDKFNELKE